MRELLQCAHNSAGTQSTSSSWCLWSLLRTYSRDRSVTSGSIKAHVRTFRCKGIKTPGEKGLGGWREGEDAEDRWARIPEVQVHLDTLLSLPEKPRSKNTATTDRLHHSCSLGPPCFHYARNSWLNKSEKSAGVYVWGGEPIKTHPGHGILSPTNTQHTCTCTQEALNARPLNTELQGRHVASTRWPFLNQTQALY